MLSAQLDVDVWKAVRALDAEQVKALLTPMEINGGATKPDDMRNEDGLTALQWLCSAPETRLQATARLDLAVALLELGASPNLQDARGYAPIHFAAYHAEHQLVADLLAHEADPNLANLQGENALHMALRGPMMGPDRQKTLKALLDAGTNVNAKTLAGFSPLMQLCRYEPRLESPVVADQNIRDIAEMFLKAGAQIGSRDSLGKTPFYLALERGHRETVFFLLEKGARAKDSGLPGRSPLHVAVNLRDADLVSAILHHDVDVNAKLPGQWKPAGITYFFPGGSTPLDVALIHAHDSPVTNHQKEWKLIAGIIKKNGGRDATYAQYVKGFQKMSGPPKSSKTRIR